MPGDEGAGLAVLDASIAVRWLVPEIGSNVAIALVNESISWIAPRLLVTEIAATLRRKITDGALALEDGIEATSAFKAAVADSVIRLANDEDLLPAALTIALSVGHKLPDCMYLALAERYGADLATADKALARIAKERNVPVRFISSE